MRLPADSSEGMIQQGRAYPSHFIIVCLEILHRKRERIVSDLRPHLLNDSSETLAAISMLCKMTKAFLKEYCPKP